jgi:hypothetical protein
MKKVMGVGADATSVKLKKIKAKILAYLDD